MIKSHYQKEIILEKPCLLGDTGRQVRKIQEWLNIRAINAPQLYQTACSVDGVFGPATEQAVLQFQYAEGLLENGCIDPAQFRLLCSPLINAFELPINSSDIRSLIVNTARQHLKQQPVELQIGELDNLGPWVRSYCEGKDGNEWKWCMGFVQTILDQACAYLNRKLTDLMPVTYSCDLAAANALNAGALVRSEDLRKNPALAQPGDIFLIRQSSDDWVHTGIIIGISEKCFDTIEGNTNINGSPNGIGVMRRTRNFQLSRIDVITLDPLTAYWNMCL